MAFIVTAPAAMAAEPSAPSTEYRDWIEDMKRSERGPFARVLWFCKDGTTQPPVSHGCRDHGGGHQHGDWSERTRTLRAEGYWIANLLSPLDAAILPDEQDFPDRLAHILIEKFLVGIDDGWILRRAMFYRGAIQEEGERAGAERLLKSLAARPYWLREGFPMLRTAVRILPHGTDTESIAFVRQESASLATRDPAFAPLRAKIHGSPDAGDAERVRGYAAERAPDELRDDYLQLAAAIDQVHAPEPLAELLRERAAAYDRGPWLQDILRAAAERFDAAADPASRFRVTGQVLADLREALPRIESASVRLQVLDIGLRVEQEHFRAASELRPDLHLRTRRELLELAFAAARAGYGTGLINARLMGELTRLESALELDSIPLGRYRESLSWLGRAPGWAMQALQMRFQRPMDRIAEIEPLAHLFIQDQLRASPLLFHAQLLEALMQDAGALAGVRHTLFGVETGYGLTALNPGLARGRLHADSRAGLPETFRDDGIYLLPETVAELPPVAGILTAGEGNPLSHVQLLARNLGIPNVVVAESLIASLAEQDGADVVLAVTPGGLVELDHWSDRWASFIAPARRGADVTIRPDLDKLDLGQREPVPLIELRADDSGRTVGPKAAKLGELRHHYPEAVARGVALPFGIFFEQALLRPWPGDPSGETTVFEWMKREYQQLGQLEDGSDARAAATETFRERLHQTIAATPIGPGVRAALEAELRDVFGPPPWPGLFIRSDTNVEDLPGFTGAGLNLTLPNVIGFEALLAGIPRVWASPFTARAFAWRQALMQDPEHVYTSVLLLESVPVDKSGVLVTRDIDSGEMRVLSVAVNEGPGGAVDGQAAESLRIPLDGSPVRVLATATAPTRRVLLPEGGVAERPASGSDTVLLPPEIDRLIEFARNLPDRFPPITDAGGRPAPADVEFGFEDGELRLFQIRPFLDSAAARGSEYLRRLDATLAARRELVVPLDEVAHR